MGRNNSGLSEADISDVICILHPCSPAAFRIVATTAEEAPHNVLQNDGFEDYNDELTQSMLEEQETFIISGNGPHQAMDLALRFSTRTKDPRRGFIFGRHADACDIVLATDMLKRVSNVHFSIFLNNSGVLMLQDMSTNGTIVDDIVLRGKTARGPQTRMLNPGSIIQILSPMAEDVVKFIVRIPTREGHLEDYEAKFQAYVRRAADEEAKVHGNNLLPRRLTALHPRTHSTASIKAPLVQNQYGMHWGGGDKYNVVGLIGKGAFATVYQLATKNEGQLFAAKELEKRKFMKNGVLDRKLDNEMQIMKAVSHEHIVQYIDYQDHATHMYIIMEFVPCGDLQGYLRNGTLPEILGKKMASQVLDALAYLHKKKITHRDIKPDNILIANMDPEQFSVKLSDFGLSKVVTDNETFLKTFCGTLLYCAPEVFPHYDTHAAGKGKKRTRRAVSQQPLKFHSYSQSVDVWSFGAVLWFSLCLKPPFEGVADNTGRGMFDKIMMTPLDAAELVRQGVSDDAIALLVEMLNTDPATRPSPITCLQHRWFGFSISVNAGAEEDGLGPIAEEEELGAGDELDVSSLSLGEEETNSPSQQSELSLHSGSVDFLDPRQSKRFKSGVHAYRDHDQLIESSPELLYQSIPIIHQPEAGPARVAQTQPPRKKLFGEISQAALASSQVLGRQHSSADEISDLSEDYDARSEYQEHAVHAQAVDAVALLASPSLLGAESLVREMNMDSPQSGRSRGGTSDEPITPRTPGVVENGSHTSAVSKKDDTTPKQPQRPFFSRQINIPIPASFYYDAHDPSTHTLEYATKVSGHDYVSNPSFLAPSAETSMPPTLNGSATENEESTDIDEVPFAHPHFTASHQPSSQFIKPPPRLGKLVSTPDSFAPITINITNRASQWGRIPSNTNPYPDKNETRVPKRGIMIWFHGKDIDKIPEEDHTAWLALPDLHCVIATESSQGLYINGVLLKKGEPGKMMFGRVFSGDEIVVSQPVSKDGRAGLRFVCEFYHGEASKRRLDGSPRFVIEREGGTVAKSKGKEKEGGGGAAPSTTRKKTVVA